MSYKGISFPFRFNGRGGVATSTTSDSDFTHIEESIKQIWLTRVFERHFEHHVGTRAVESQFSVGDEIDSATLALELKRALSLLEDRITVDDIIVTFESEEGTTISSFNVELKYTVIKYSSTKTLSLEFGGVNEY